MKTQHYSKKEISDLNKPMENLQHNYFFSYDHKSKYLYWQSHLEIIPDFLPENEEVLLKKTKFGIAVFDFDSFDQLTINPKPNHLYYIIIQNKSIISQNKTALPIAFILYKGQKNKKIISANLVYNQFSKILH